MCIYIHIHIWICMYVYACWPSKHQLRSRYSSFATTSWTSATWLWPEWFEGLVFRVKGYGAPKSEFHPATYLYWV